ncbi:MAG: VCBS repeat-containing protein [Anaerolineales bacterium]|nr:VCBS repeat-containing protein [Anaerolineales bacterium]
MKIRRFALAFSLILASGLLVGAIWIASFAAPMPVLLSPPPNSHTASPDTHISITYDEPINATTVNSATFAVYGMQSGLVTGTHGVSGSMIVVTPTHPFHQGELVYAIATTRTLNITGTGPEYATQWQFNVGKVTGRCSSGFTDINAGLPEVSGGRSSWGDYDRDGDLDLLLAGHIYDGDDISRIYRNDGNDIFTDIDAGLLGLWKGEAAWGDYDMDGDLDILLTGYNWSSITRFSKVYRNDKGSFSDIGAGLTGVTNGSSAWGDYDNDGDLDVLLTGLDTILLYRNDGNDQFNLQDSGLEGAYEDINSTLWGDYDNDGDLDILLSGSHEGKGYCSLIYRNDNGIFSEIDVGLTGVYNSSTAWGDYDNDGDLDILLSGDSGAGYVSLVYRNNGDDAFEDIGAGLMGIRQGAVAWGDYDNDGDLDIFQNGYTEASFNVARIYTNHGDDTFTVSPAWFGPTEADIGVDWGDYDGDGDLDIIVTGAHVTAKTSIFRNDDCPVDVVIEKTVDPATALAGDQVTYTISFSNLGGSTATQVVIEDDLPAEFVVTGIYSQGVAITQTSTAYTWTTADLALNQGGIITLTGHLVSPLEGGLQIDNIATIDCAEDEINEFNNSNKATITIHNVPAMVVAKSANVAETRVGETITYTYRVTNTGNVPLGLAAHDDKLGDLDLEPDVINPGQTAWDQIPYTVLEDDLPGPITNTVMVWGWPDVGFTITEEATLSIEFEVDNWSIFLPLVIRQ